ncbi:MAG: rhodanese-like domain-containing protein [Candidatus Nanopelagicaceae bacterium]|nr:rhodanese-like domain-containing protein [Candidatus Nanopelagicaceae bacterium]
MTQTLTPQQAAEMIRRGDAYGIDVREPDEWSAGRAPGVTTNPLSSFNAATLPSDKPLIFICRSGNRSGRVCDALAPTRTNIYNMVGGMQAWHGAGLPMVSDSGNPRVA